MTNPTMDKPAPSDPVWRTLNAEALARYLYQTRKISLQLGIQMAMAMPSTALCDALDNLHIVTEIPGNDAGIAVEKPHHIEKIMFALAGKSHIVYCGLVKEGHNNRPEPVYDGICESCDWESSQYYENEDDTHNEMKDHMDAVFAGLEDDE